jgi:DNA-binding protein H-NS
MGRVSWSSLSVNELWDLHQEIAAKLKHLLEAEKGRLDELLRKIEPSNPSFSDRPYPKVFSKYQNPNDASETWSGRGKKPQWVEAQLRSGKRMEDLRITHEARR